MDGKTKLSPIQEGYSTSLSPKTKRYSKGSLSPKTKRYSKGSLSPKTKRYSKGSLSPKTKRYSKGSLSPKTKRYPKGSLSPKTKRLPKTIRSRSLNKTFTNRTRKNVAFKSLTHEDKTFFILKFMDETIKLSENLIEITEDIIVNRKKFKKSIFSSKKRKYSQRLLKASRDFHNYLLIWSNKHVSFKKRYIDPMYERNGGGFFGKQSATEQDLLKMIQSLKGLINVFNKAKERFIEYPKMMNKENITNIYNTSLSVLFRSNVSLQETIIPMLQKFKIEY